MPRMLSRDILTEWHLLIVDQMRIDAAEGQQFLVRTTFHDKTLIKDKNQIGVANGTESVSTMRVQAKSLRF